MPRFFVAPVAQQDTVAVLRWTDDQWGADARIRYEALLVQAIMDVAGNPNLPGSNRRPEIASSARTYHLIHSRNHIAVEAGRVKRPRHLLLYRTRSDAAVEIGRVIHESMDLARHLPDEYRP
ncbi:MAG TPA: type II toxin-antitoxin system RelE/ParE family toxin [Lacipirellulaceae bacterium]|nr:type II toxin-antitoxin system RelE/ParE family toxin [Lacipirellulaceae bacterium]